MKNHALSIASDIIYAHMNNKLFFFEESLKYKIGLYSSSKNLLYGEDIKGVDFKKDIYMKEEQLYIIDQSAQLHLGVKYIVLKDNEFKLIKSNLLKKVIFFTIFALIFVSIIGYFLSKIFLKPIANEREKLDRFIKDTTHELNTPISALLMSLSSLNSENPKLTQRISISAKRISNIYDDLCYLLKDESNKNKELKLINLKDVIQEQILLAEGYANSKKISIKKDICDFEFLIDEESVKRLINNLISNALKYSKANTTIEIILKDQKLTIKDNGYGIKQEDLKNIKNRYFRANNTELGFGIGLDIVNNICKKYDIDFNIQSHYKEGTLVSLKFS